MNAKNIYDKEKKEFIKYDNETILLFDEIDKVPKDN